MNVQERVAAVLACVVLAGMSGAATETPMPLAAGPLKDYNLVIMLVDALRPDHLGCYGYNRNTSPYIDSLAKEGVLFEDAWSNSSYTRISVSSMFMGRLPSNGGAVGFRACPSTAVPGLGALYKQSGYATAFISNSAMTKLTDYHDGFDLVYHANDREHVTGKFTNAAKRFVAEQGQGKFMMYLHYQAVHAPYAPRDDTYMRFADRRFPDPITVAQWRNEYAKQVKAGCVPGNPRFDEMVLRYDAQIAHVDDRFRELIEDMRDQGVLDNTLLVVMADHGEEFFEHRYLEHTWTLYNEALHIPLIFYAPRALRPARIGEHVELVDFLPTALELMAIPHARDDFDGKPLFKRGAGGLHFERAPRPYISEVTIQEFSMLRTVTSGGWKYIAAQKWLEPAERPGALRRRKQFMQELNTGKRKPLDIWGPVVHEELYHLSEDPGETKDLKDAAPAKKAELAGILDDYSARCKTSGLEAKKETPAEQHLDAEDEEALKALGYM